MGSTRAAATRLDASESLPGVRGGRVLCVFDFCAACGARAAAYQALFVQRRGCQSFVLQFVLAWVPVGLFLDVY